MISTIRMYLTITLQDGTEDQPESSFLVTNHLARDFYSPQQVKIALEKLNKKGNMYVCVEDVVHFSEGFDDRDDDE